MKPTKRDQIAEILKREFNRTGDQVERAVALILAVIRTHKRSNEQNRYYWGVIIELTSAHYGYEPDEMHEVWAWKFLNMTEPGSALPRRRRTSSPDFTTRDAEEYYERIRRFVLTDCGLMIPLPHEVTE